MIEYSVVSGSLTYEFVCFAGTELCVLLVQVGGNQVDPASH